MRTTKVKIINKQRIMCITRYFRFELRRGPDVNRDLSIFFCASSGSFLLSLRYSDYDYLCGYEKNSDTSGFAFCCADGNIGTRYLPYAGIQAGCDILSRADSRAGQA